MTEPMWKKRLLSTSLFAGAMLAATSPFAAVAQEADEATVEVTTTADDESRQEKITITGSRVANPNLEQASQVQSVGEAEVLLQNVNLAEDLVRKLPGIVPATGPAVNNGQSGASTVNLRGLGTNRNLVLVNGRRMVPFGLGGVSDLNHIPLSLVERVDVVSGGASSVYGADAVTGVINFIVKDNFEGLDLQASRRISQEGDGETLRADLTLGGNFDDGRGNVVTSFGYQKSDPVLQGDREYGFSSLSSTTGNPGGSSAAVPAVISAPGLFGQINPATGAIDSTVTLYNFNPLNLYQTPVERYNVYSAARYEVTPGVEAFGDAFFTRSNIVINLAPSASFFNTYALPLSNPFLPDAARNQICGAFSIGIAECNAAALATDASDPNYQEVNLGIRRRFVEFGPRVGDYQTDAFQMTGGLRGTIEDRWNWEVSASYGESELTQTVSRYGLFSRLQQALRAVDETTCQNTSGGCVPMNLFGADGAITQDMLNFIEAPSTTVTETAFTQIVATIAGDLGAIRSPFAETEIGVAGGLEYREYSALSAGDFLGSVPGELLGAGGADPITGGRYDVYEIFGEVIAPLVEGAPLVESLTLEAGVRSSDYSTTGSSFTWKAGSTWEVVPDWKLRGVYQVATRSPNIGELFFPVQVGLDNFATDPCAGAAPVGNANLAAICTAQGAPGGSIGLITNPAAGQVNITTGGNPDLDVEQAETFTIGLIAQPAFLPNFTFSIDYFNIKVEDAVSEPSVGDILDGCFDASFNPGLTFNASCALIGRNPVDGSLNGSPADVPGVILQSSNLGAYETSGIDWSLAYMYETASIGTFDYSMNGTYTFENKFQATPVSENRDCLGYYSTNCGNIQPEVQFNQRLSWTQGNMVLSARHRYLSSTGIEPALAGSFLADFESIDAYNYVDVTGRYSLTSNVDLTLTIDNVFDKEPPIVGNDIGPTSFNSGNTYPTVYDAIGRTYTVAVRVRF